MTQHPRRRRSGPVRSRRPTLPQFQAAARLCCWTVPCLPAIRDPSPSHCRPTTDVPLLSDNGFRARGMRAPTNALTRTCDCQTMPSRARASRHRKCASKPRARTPTPALGRQLGAKGLGRVRAMEPWRSRGGRSRFPMTGHCCRMLVGLLLGGAAPRSDSAASARPTLRVPRRIAG